MPVHPGRALLGVPVRVDLDDARTELAAGRFRDAKVGMEGSLPQSRPELAVLGVVEGKVLLLLAVQTFVAHCMALILKVEVVPGSGHVIGSLPGDFEEIAGVWGRPVGRLGEAVFRPRRG